MGFDPKPTHLQCYLRQFQNKIINIQVPHYLTSAKYGIVNSGSQIFLHKTVSKSKQK